MHHFVYYFSTFHPSKALKDRTISRYLYYSLIKIVGKILPINISVAEPDHLMKILPKHVDYMAARYFLLFSDKAESSVTTARGAYISNEFSLVTGECVFNEAATPA